MVRRRAFFAVCPIDSGFSLVTPGELNVWLRRGAGDDRRTLDGSTGANDRFGADEDSLTWTATPRPRPSVDKVRFWAVLLE